MKIGYCSIFSFSLLISYEHVFIVINSFIEKYPIKTFYFNQAHLNFPWNSLILKLIEIAELPFSLNTNIQLFCLNYHIKG